MNDRTLPARKLSVAVFGAATLFLSAYAGTAHADVIVTQYTFEAYTAPVGATTTVSGITADTGTGTGSASHVSASTVYSTPAGNGSAKALSSNNWAVGDYYQFTADLTGVTGSQLEFDQVSSGTGPLNFKVQISTDGSTFTDLAGGAYAVSGSVGFATSGVKTNSPPRYLFDISALDGFSTAAIRLVDTTAPSGTAGTDRVDNVTFGTNLTPPTVAAPEPASLGILALGGLLLLRRKK